MKFFESGLILINIYFALIEESGKALLNMQKKPYTLHI